jgi:hypothetical protein
MLQRIAIMLAVVVTCNCGWANDCMVYDLASDWSNVDNPNGTWSCNHGDEPLLYRKVNWGGIAGETFWCAMPSGTHPPAWCKAVTEYNAPHWVPGDVIVHSTTQNSGYGLASVTWTAPADGTISIVGRAWDAFHYSERDDAWHLTVNDTVYALRESIQDVARDAPEARFEDNLLPGMSLQDITVLAGDVLRFQVSAISHYGHFVGVDLQIEFTPTQALIEDDFDNGALDECLWWEEGAVDESDGVAHFYSPDGAQAALLTRQVLRGDFCITVDFALLEFAFSPELAVAQLVVMFEEGDPVNTVSISRVRGAPDDLDLYVFQRYQNAAFEPTNDMSGRLRLQRTGTRFRAFYWSSMSGDWNEIEAEINGPSTPCKVVLTTYGLISIDPPVFGGPTVRADLDDFLAWAEGITPPSDCDWDGDIDLDDFTHMAAECMLGPGIDSCVCSDADCDRDTDIVDFALFQRVMSGPQP